MVVGQEVGSLAVQVVAVEVEVEATSTKQDALSRTEALVLQLGRVVQAQLEHQVTAAAVEVVVSMGLLRSEVGAVVGMAQTG